MTLETQRAGERIIFGDAKEIADLSFKPEFTWYGVWTDQQGKFALCKVWPCPSWKEITKRELYQAAA